MRSLRPFLLAILVSVAAAQSPKTTAQFHLAPQAPQACPVGFSVSRSSATEIIQTRNAPPDPDTQAIDLRFQTAGEESLRGADVVVHVLTGGPGLLPTAEDSTGSKRGAVDRRFHLELNPGSVVRRRIALGHVNGVLSVDLVAMEFTDSTTWKSSEEVACRAVPSLLLRIAAR